MTNIVLLSSLLLTNVNTAFLGKTNGTAVLVHLETVSRKDVEGLKQRFHKAVPFRTNVVVVGQRQWQELVRDLEPKKAIDPSMQLLTPTPTAAVKSPVVRPGPNTNSPAFKRQQLNK